MKKSRSGLDFHKLNWYSLSLARRKEVAQTFGLHAKNRWGATFWTESLHEPSAVALAFAKWLVEQGQSIEARDQNRRTGLHIAAIRRNLPAVEWLLASGANVHAKDWEAHTPLEAMLFLTQNPDLPDLPPIVEALLRGGAKVTPEAQRGVLHAYESMDSLRERMPPAFRKKCEAAARKLCDQMGVTPPSPRMVHDGRSEITVGEGSLQERFEALWKSLVPGQGPAKTVQGETIRIAGRINDELLGNGAANWDREYHKMARAFGRYVRMGEALEAKALAQIDALIDEIACASPADDAHPLYRFAVAWVKKNPKPIQRGTVDYRR
jgi:hypothetical protein